MKKLINHLIVTTCSALIGISLVVSPDVNAKSITGIDSLTDQSVQSEGTWVEVVRYIPVYRDGVLVGYIAYRTREFIMER